jgi:hypothetical protein
MYVLEFLNKKDIEKFFDNKSLKVVEYLLRKVLYSQPEVLPDQKKGYIQITKEFLEQWVAQGLGWKIVGSGSYPIDVYSKEKRIGADVKFMSVKVRENGEFSSEQSGETSLGQKFTGSGNELDQDFASKSYDKILNGWKFILKNKLKAPIRDYNIKNIYYFIFIRGGDTINLSIAKVNSGAIDRINVKNTTASSVFVDGFIDPKYGNVKIYKAKKRMELRCLPRSMNKDNLFVQWDFSKLVRREGVDLRLKVGDYGDFKKYVKRDLDSFFNSL